MMLLYVIHHTIVLQCTANMPEGASVSLLQTKTLFVRVKACFCSHVQQGETFPVCEACFKRNETGQRCQPYVSKHKEKGKECFLIRIGDAPLTVFYGSQSLVFTQSTFCFFIFYVNISDMTQQHK